MTLPIGAGMGRIKFASLREDIQAFVQTGEALPVLQVRIATLNGDARRKRERYANDPAHREKKKAAARAWNAANPDARRASTLRWNRTRGAAAARRYRQRCKERQAA